ncbi:MAG: helix-turn-helix transcriptional regulator [Methylococcales bacterium]
MSVHEKIRLIRETKGLTQEQLAEKLKMSPSAYGDIERGDSDIKLSRLEKIAESLEIKLSELFELNEKGSFNIINSLHSNNETKIHISSSASELEKQLAINGLQVKEIAMKDRENDNLREIIALLKREQPQPKPI